MRVSQKTIEELQEALRALQQAQAECITEYGYIKLECRYRYQLLVRQARDLKESIEFLGSLSTTPDAEHTVNP